MATEDDFYEPDFSFTEQDDTYKNDDVVCVFDKKIINFFKEYMDKNERDYFYRDDKEKIKVDDIKKYLRLKYIADKAMEKEKFNIAEFILDHIRPVSISLLVWLNILTNGDGNCISCK